MEPSLPGRRMAQGRTDTEDDAARTATWSPSRLAEVDRSGLVGLLSHPHIDEAVAMASDLLRAPFAYVTVLADTRCMVKAATGFPEDLALDAPAEESFCQYVAAVDDHVLIADTTLDPRTRTKAAVSGMGLRSWAAHPIRSATGEVLGTLSVADRHPRHWTDQEARILRVLAGSVSIELARSLTAREAAKSLERSSALAQLAHRLAGAGSDREIGELLSRFVPLAVGCDRVEVAMVSQDGRNLRVDPDAGPGVPAGAGAGATAARRRDLPLEFPAPLTDAVREESEVWIADRQEFAARYPHLVRVDERDVVTTTAAIPVLDVDGMPLAGLELGWRGRVEPDDELRGRLDTVVGICAQAIRRAQLGVAQTDLIGVMRSHLLPPVAVVPGADIGVRYRPANHHLGLGGDWYDVIHLGGGRVAVVVGDVAGHGIEATARMLSIQSVLNTLVRIGWRLEEVFPRTEELLSYLDDAYLATVAVLVVDLPGERIAHVSAGHPLPVLVPPGGAPRALTTGRRRVLGRPGPAVEVGWDPFPTGSAVVVYTDGLIERPEEPIDAAMDRLVAVLAESDERDADAVADRLVQELAADYRRDDLAVVVLRSEPA
jgi:GAF domain-containing protein